MDKETIRELIELIKENAQFKSNDNYFLMRMPIEHEELFQELLQTLEMSLEDEVLNRN